uniref:Uncharacterized protein n=2 Tax=Cacopsylla melanoneura TaxID=428564 RepID=A0A8D9E690_9HEMI
MSIRYNINMISSRTYFESTVKNPTYHCIHTLSYFYPQIALLLSGLCQYISHPGFTIRNSTMELHHYKVTEMLVAKSGLFRNEPEHAKVIMEKVQALMMSIQHPTNAEIVSNISTAFTTTGMDWSQPEHRDWILTLLLNTSNLNMMCKPYFECRKHLIEYLQNTERPNKQCSDLITMLKEFDLDGKVMIQFYFLSNLVPYDGHLLDLMSENLSLLYAKKQK